MFGPISPKVKDLTQHLNTWSKDQIFANKLPAASNQNRISPASIWEGQGHSTGTGISIPLRYRAFTQPVPANPAYGDWKLQYSLNNAAYTDALVYSAAGYTGSKPLFSVSAYQRILTDNSSTVDTLLSLDVRSSGNTNHVGLSFGSTTRSAWSVTSQGTTEFRTAGSSALHSFFIGSSIGSQTLIAQIYSSGFYNSYSNFNNGKVTAGSADQTVQTTLSTYGSFAGKGVLVTSASYTLTENEMFVYVDPSNASFCVGTPVACNTYLTEGNCNAHTGVGCSWFAGTSCSIYNGDPSSCSGQAGCTVEETSCSSANNTDQSTCEGQDDAFGGTCSWDTSTCPAQTSDAACSAITGCTSDNSGDCTAFTNTVDCGNQVGCTPVVDGDCTALSDGGGDGSNCATQPECSYDSGSGACTGSYFTACSGNYFVGCNGNLCGGTYTTGNCTGNFGAECQGTASCANLTGSGSVACVAEGGCTWQVGVNITLPTTANASRGTVGRVYSIMHVGPTGTVSISGQSGQPVFQYTTLNLLKKGDKVLLHNQNITFQCSVFTSSTPCNAQTGCTWLPTCSTIGDQPTCDGTSGCAWDGENNVCTGPSARCSGTYSNGSHWYAHSLERGLNYTEKTASYTLLDIDDVVNCTANSFNITLPSAALMNGKRFVVKNTGTGVITILTTSSQTVDGFASGVLTLNQGDSLEIVSNNVNWVIV